jgi:hypothetical protein
LRVIDGDPGPAHARARLPEAARRTALAVAQALLPAGERFRGADARTIDRLEHVLASFGEATLRHFTAVFAALEHATRPTHFGRGFSSLRLDQRARFLAKISDGNTMERSLALAVTAPLKVAHFDDPEIYESLGARWRHQAVRENARWMERVTHAGELDDDVELEADVVVVGTGAGGAVVARELASRGLAVLMLEEGAYVQRDRFTGGMIEALTTLYRGRGIVGSVGNTVIPIPSGRLVGGSTAVNTGTCWRTPPWVCERWVREDGLVELAADRLEPYFERVWRDLEIGPSPPEALGAVARVIARGADALGYAHHAVDRNAPGCDGSGVCDTGCPTDARKSTNVSYVPSALKNGAELYTGVRATKLLFKGAHVEGVAGRTASGRRVTVRARATVLACGTLMTPTVLQRSGVDGRHVGRNLSIHPATIVSALFDEPIRGYASVPQGYTVDEWRREGILLLGASAPIDVGACQFSFVGRELMDLMEKYDRIASFGVMVEDASRGRVRGGPGGRPIITYWLGREERERLVRGTAALARIFLAAGAREVLPALHGHRRIKDAADVRKLERSLPAAQDWILTAFHPLGTCRMARSPKDGVVSPDHEVFGLTGLYVADGSVVPSSVGVNPQVTIMALAMRGAERIAAGLEA